MPEMSTASGRSAQSRSVWSPTPTMMTEPTTTPRAVPPTARTTVAPVPSALERSTDRVPRTTQKPCWTSMTSITATARASPMAPRTLVRNPGGDGCVGHAHLPLDDGFDPGRLERCVGDQPGGDPESPGVKSRVQGDRQALLFDRLTLAAAGRATGRERCHIAHRRHV